MVKNLRLLRLSKGISQQVLADYLNISQQSVYKYERGKYEPDIGTLIILADYFGTSVDYLIGHTAANQGPPQGLEISREEWKLLCGYRQLSEREKHSIELVIQNYLNH